MNYRTVFHNLGNILIIESLFMLLPVLVAVIYGETAGFSFAVSALVLVAATLFMICALVAEPYLLIIYFYFFPISYIMAKRGYNAIIVRPAPLTK